MIAEKKFLCVIWVGSEEAFILLYLTFDSVFPQFKKPKFKTKASFAKFSCILFKFLNAID
ncbi:MAG TPA: hypothetical protein PK079_08235 [Leptospiraceae bacterium]|nr:hypothetical protein [Leptospiraceae bacterium]HMW06314.1 hypothetical protein [Leptospiraceae bacterium]HMX31007.1 hypothetical protein [Leptospiraceae bacterium]HMY32174.1 hypothetical protein [Leptospiraceae bacterium]HMZ65097.1 hypothetical protein [Leptospiraceae bacterium]